MRGPHDAISWLVTLIVIIVLVIILFKVLAIIL